MEYTFQLSSVDPFAFFDPGALAFVFLCQEVADHVRCSDMMIGNHLKDTRLAAGTAWLHTSIAATLPPELARPLV